MRQKAVICPWLFSLLLLIAICLPLQALEPINNPTINTPKKGLFLVASRSMMDPRFVQSVIFLVSVDEAGALGLMINHPSVHLLWDLIPSLKNDGAGKRKIYVGGPVELNTITVLFRNRKPKSSSFRVADDIYFSGNKRIILEQARSASTSVRILIGNAGWGPGQLENEIDEGSWHLVSADPALVFREETENLWRELIPVAGNWVLRGSSDRLLPVEALDAGSPRSRCKLAYGRELRSPGM